jgi:tRNA (guanine-N7-)-methyltransferase
MSIDQDSQTAPDSVRRKIRSFVKREGRFTQAQQRAFDMYWDTYGLEFRDEYLDLQHLFSRTASTILEIGFGNGESLATMAKKHPDNNYIGIEVHRPGAGQLLQQLVNKSLTNVRVSTHDAVEVLKHQIPDESLQGVQIFFPDPWPKKRHHKRRIIQSEFMSLLATKLKPAGFVHLATDWEPYADHMLEVMQSHPDFHNTVDSFIGKPETRPLTKFEQRGLKLGHQIRDLMFIRKRD